MILTREACLEGQVILIDKPLEWTSFQVVNKLRWLLRKNLNIKKIKVGHAGTLDPLATGLLIVCCGKMTKQIQHFQAQEKKYTGQFLLGSTTPSYDLETEMDAHFPVDHIQKEDIEKEIDHFIGEIDQYPPVFSAIKKEGKRLYELAREGKEVEVPKRKVHIHSFTINSENFPHLSFEVSCSKGTYIRSLAHDFGKALQSGAHLTELRRTQIGDFHVNDALSIEEFTQKIEQARLKKDE